MKTYISTRGGQTNLNFYQAIVQGIACDGGLIVPEFELPSLDLEKIRNMNYVQLASEILSSFVPTSDKDSITKICRNAYGSGLFPENPVPVKNIDICSVAELFHGPTAAFKDMALTILPHFMTMSLKKTGENRDVLILAATSGDTGKAALEGFRDVDGTKILVFYPTDGVSPVQKQQMVSQKGKNVDVVGIKGNFDDAQKAVKMAFANKDITEKSGIFLSSANSINIGRLIPQIVYYFSSYFQLVSDGKIKIGDKVNFCVPSGNFGDCLAGWLAREMGLPVARFLIASNRNKILSDFFNTGIYDTRREFYKTNAPAMDILVSSNLERLLWFVSGKDSHKVRELMEKLASDGVYEIDDQLKQRIAEDFSAGYIDEAEILETIKYCFNSCGYLLDTHTACGYGFLKKYQENSGDMTPCILMSTASPYKFPESVYEAIYNERLEPYEAMEELEKKSRIPMQEALRGIKDREVLHNKVIDRNFIEEYIISSYAKKNIQ